MKRGRDGGSYDDGFSSTFRAEKERLREKGKWIKSVEKRNNERAMG